jgi:hypothetical protein
LRATAPSCFDRRNSQKQAPPVRPYSRQTGCIFPYSFRIPSDGKLILSMTGQSSLLAIVSRKFVSKALFMRSPRRLAVIS